MRQSHKIFLKRNFCILRMSESISVTDHINNLNTLFSKLAAMDYNIKENERAELLLHSLPDSYDQLITNLTNNVLTDFTSMMLQLLFYKRNLGTKVMKIDHSLRNKQRRYWWQEEDQWNPTLVGVKILGDQSREAKKYIKCHFCDKRGHIKRDCWNYKKSIEKTSKATTSQGCVASPSDDGELLCVDASITPKANSLTDV